MPYQEDKIFYFHTFTKCLSKNLSWFSYYKCLGWGKVERIKTLNNTKVKPQPSMELLGVTVDNELKLESAYDSSQQHISSLLF